MIDRFDQTRQLVVGDGEKHQVGGLEHLRHIDQGTPGNISAARLRLRSETAWAATTR